MRGYHLGDKYWLYILETHERTRTNLTEHIRSSVDSTVSEGEQPRLVKGQHHQQSEQRIFEANQIQKVRNCAKDPKGWGLDTKKCKSASIDYRHFSTESWTFMDQRMHPNNFHHF